MRRFGIVSVLMLATPPFVGAQDTALAGLWRAGHWFGPELRGELVLARTANRWDASIGGRKAEARVARDSVYVDFPSGGTFTGRVARNGTSVVGHWIQPRAAESGRRYATPLVLAPCGTGCYSGNVRPMEDAFTFYMEVTPRSDGKLAAFLRNPERNQGRFIPVTHVTRRADTVHLRRADDSVIATGVLRGGMLSVPLRGSTFDFRRVHPDSFTDYYPRGRRVASYEYARPRARNDGWTVATPEDVGMSRQKLTEMVQLVAHASVDSMNALRLHGILVARHGKLVLEEYFLGEHADRPHDTRSGSKTIATAVLGAAMHAGMKVGPETSVFATMGEESPTLDPRKRAMNVGHLLTMTSGLDCDDNSGTYHPGSENTLTGQDTNPDWLRLVLGLKMLRDPGAQFAYCSINSYLAGEVVARATGRSFLDLTWELLGAPLQMGRYHVSLTPLGAAYMGGGTRYLPRDFLKLAQLYANGGTWNGRRILSQAWIEESIKPRFQAGPTSQNGYLWWSIEYPYQGRRVRAYYAAGNGGQYSMFIPELGLVVGAYGGNYAERAGSITVRELIPNYILTAIVR
jgi:CubicO group peptidase (beta-lactamase class C family)